MAEKPYHPVAQGGFWNTAQPNISKQTQKLLKSSFNPLNDLSNLF